MHEKVHFVTELIPPSKLYVQYEVVHSLLIIVVFFLCRHLFPIYEEELSRFSTKSKSYTILISLIYSKRMGVTLKLTQYHIAGFFF